MGLAFSQGIVRAHCLSAAQGVKYKKKTDRKDDRGAKIRRNATGWLEVKKKRIRYASKLPKKNKGQDKEEDVTGTKATGSRRIAH